MDKPSASPMMKDAEMSFPTDNVSASDIEMAYELLLGRMPENKEIGCSLALIKKDLNA